MPDRRQLDDQEAAQRRRAWLEDRRRWNRDLVVVLLRYAPEVDVARALDLLSAGELQRLARLFAQATDLHHVASPLTSSSTWTTSRPGRHPARLDRPRRHRRTHDQAPTARVCRPPRPLDPEGPFVALLTLPWVV